MRSFFTISLAFYQAFGQHGGMDGMESGAGGMGSGEMESGIGGMGSGMGGMGSGSGGIGSGMGGGMDECCPHKKIWGSQNPMMDGMYKNVGKMPMNQLPRRCNSPCVYEKKGGMDGMQYCFADSFSSQSMCDSMDVGSTGGPDDGETPVDMGSGSGSKTTDMGGMGLTTMGMGGKTTGMSENEGKETTEGPSSGDGMEDHGSGSTTGMVSPGNKETTMEGKETTKGMEGHGGKETTEGMEGHGEKETTKGMSDHVGDMEMGDHGGKETTKGMSDHGGDMGMGDHGGKKMILNKKK